MGEAASSGRGQFLERDTWLWADSGQHFEEQEEDPLLSWRGQEQRTTAPTTAPGAAQTYCSRQKSPGLGTASLTLYSLGRFPLTAPLRARIRGGALKLYAVPQTLPLWVFSAEVPQDPAPAAYL